MRSRLPIALAAAALIALGAAPVAAGARAGAKLAADPPGGSLTGPGRVAVALPLRDVGGGTARRVRVTAIALTGAGPVRLAGTRLPIRLGAIPPRGAATVFATLQGKRLTAGGRYVLRVAGTFASGRRTVRFSVARALRLPPPAPGRAVASSTVSAPHVVRGAPFPPTAPGSLDDVNDTPGWVVPRGPFHRPPPRSPATAPRAAKAGPASAQAAGGGVRLFTDAPLGIPGRTTNEPSGAAGGGVVFLTVNAFAAFSTSGGASFTRVDPTAVFPQDGAVGSFCCDQIVQYARSVDRFVWLMQQSGGMRIAVASPAALAASRGTAWTYWDIPSSQLGYGPFDFPDLSLGDRSLYASTDAGSGLLVMRFPLAQLRDGGRVEWQYTDPHDSPMAWFGHLAQDARDEIFWAGHNSNSSMRVFSWRESSGTYYWRDVAIGSWPNDIARMRSVTPDGQDWVSKLGADGTLWIGGASRVFQTPQHQRVNQLWLAWSAPSGQGFPQPHVELVVLDRAHDFHVVSQMQVWNAAHAYAYPALAANAAGEVGLSLAYGGGPLYENHAVGFWGDFLVYATTASDAGVSRFGDYVTIRPDPTDPNRLDAFGYGVRHTPGGGLRTDTRYVVFGRP